MPSQMYSAWRANLIRMAKWSLPLTAPSPCTPPSLTSSSSSSSSSLTQHSHVKAFSPRGERVRERDRSSQPNGFPLKGARPDITEHAGTKAKGRTKRKRELEPRWDCGHNQKFNVMNKLKIFCSLECVSSGQQPRKRRNFHSPKCAPFAIGKWISLSVSLEN